jgi:hypothetical protein
MAERGWFNGDNIESAVQTRLKNKKLLKEHVSWSISSNNQVTLMMTMVMIMRMIIMSLPTADSQGL